jgi:predicted GTPase
MLIYDSPKFIPDFSQIRVAQSLIVCVVCFVNLCFCFLLSFSFVHFIGLLYFIDDVNEILAHICPSCEPIDLWKRLARSGPEKTADYINQHLNRWNVEKFRFAVMGRSASGKSTFINISQNTTQTIKD